jgi:hypothetical protein
MEMVASASETEAFRIWNSGDTACFTGEKTYAFSTIFLNNTN